MRAAVCRGRVEARGRRFLGGSAAVNASESAVQNVIVIVIVMHSLCYDGQRVCRPVPPWRQRPQRELHPTAFFQLRFEPVLQQVSNWVGGLRLTRRAASIIVRPYATTASMLGDCVFEPPGHNSRTCILRIAGTTHLGHRNIVKRAAPLCCLVAFYVGQRGKRVVRPRAAHTLLSSPARYHTHSCVHPPAYRRVWRGPPSSQPV